MEININITEISYALSLALPFKMALATLIGLAIGRERKRNEKPGGARTFALVCLGACLITLLSIKMADTYTFDFARLLSYGIASIGFLGSGVIIKNQSKVEGVTTASTLWVMVPIGFCVGLGYYTLAIVTSVFVYGILESKKVRRKKNVKNKSNRQIGKSEMLDM